MSPADPARTHAPALPDGPSCVAHPNLGYALSTKVDLDGAITCNREAIRLSPEFAPAHVNLA